MKKSVLFFLLFLGLHAQAQVNLQALFDFANPTSLTPPITPNSITGAGVIVSNKTLTCGPISISFSAGVSTGGSAQIWTFTNSWNETTYYLKITQGTLMTIQSNDGAVLDSIKYDDKTVIGDLHLQSGQPGQELYYMWKSNSKTVTSVSFFNSSQASQINQMTVYYSAPSDILVPTPSIADGGTVNSFSSLTLTFGKSMSVVNTSGIRITGPGIDKPMTASASGSSVTLSVTPAIATDGTYTIHVPARSFKSSDGYENTELNYTINVQTPKNTFDFVSSDPEDFSTVALIPNGFTVTFPERIGGVVNPSNTLEVLDTNNLRVRAVKAERLGNTEPDNYSVKFTFKNGDGDITSNGTYTFTLPEGVVFDNYYDEDAADHGVSAGATYNPSHTLTFTVDESLDPSRPQDSQTMKDAKALLNKTGVGYPAANSSARMALQNLTTADEVPTDAELDAAMQAFYAETDVTMPTVGSWYSISGVSKAGRKLYLAYNNGAVKLNLSPTNSAFKVTSLNSKTVVFETFDGKYLHVLRKTGDAYVGTNENNVTDNNTYINKLDLARLAVEGSTAQETFGLLSIFGALGNNVETGDAIRAYGMIDFSTSQIATDPNLTTLCFEDNGLSNAFYIEETSEPQAANPIEPFLTITPFTIATSSETLTLSFTNVANASLTDESKLFISTNNEGTDVVEVSVEHILTPVEGKTNEFTVHVDGLGEGIFFLIMPRGTFSYANNAEAVNDVDLVVSFKIEGGDTPEPPTPTTNFSETYTHISYNLKACIGHNYDTVRDVDLNDFVVYAYKEDYNGLFFDPTKTVKLVRGLNGTGVKNGHFEAYPSFGVDFPQFSDRMAIRLVLDEPFYAGELDSRTGYYAIWIEPGTFGDQNFKKYLDGDASVNEADCIVNPQIRTSSFYVNNRNAETGIENIDADAVYGTERIYDLNGRRVTTPAKGGVYIINGKKVLIK